MKKIVLFLLVMLALGSCAREALTHHFDFDVMLPIGGVRINEVFPYQIKQMQQRLARLELPENMFGMKASYGKDESGEEISMAVVQAKITEDAENYYLSKMVPVLQAMKYVKSPVDGWDKAIYAKDKDGRQWLAWNNREWIIELSGSDDVFFQTVVRACRFVNLLE